MVFFSVLTSRISGIYPEREIGRSSLHIFVWNSGNRTQTYRGQQTLAFPYRAAISEEAQEEHDGSDRHQAVRQLFYHLRLCEVLRNKH